MKLSVQFGLMSFVVALGAFQGIVVAALLLKCRRSQTANRLLAVLLSITVLKILPSILGYAGFYDVYLFLTLPHVLWFTLPLVSRRFFPTGHGPPCRPLR